MQKWGQKKEVFREYRLAWKKAAAEDFLPEQPLNVDIELSDVCNLRCKMCAQGMGTVRGTGFMSNDVVCNIIDQCAQTGVYSIKFNWRGEATLNPFLPKAIRYAKQNGILEVQINTNGLPSQKDIIIECAENGLDRIIFSVDGFSKETYESIRINGSYERILENIHNLVDWKNNSAGSKPHIRVQMVRTKQNAHEVQEYIEYWQQLVDDVRISDVMDRGQGKDLSVGDQVVIGRRRCPQPFQRLTIGRDCRVSPCCADWDQEFILGDIRQNSLMELWQCDMINDLRKKLRNIQHHKIKICRSCPVKESYIWRKIK